MKYVSVSGDSWDLIAYRVLGSEKYVPELVAANPDLIETFIFDAGIELTIPEVETPKQSVLPWK